MGRNGGGVIVQDQAYADPGGVTRAARSVCDIAEDLSAATTKWRWGKLDAPGDALKVKEAIDPVANVRDAWEKDFSVYREVLEQWCQAATAAAQGYKSVDEYLAATMRHPSPRNVI
jgi:hypothetical protein